MAQDWQNHRMPRNIDSRIHRIRFSRIGQKCRTSRIRISLELCHKQKFYTRRKPDIPAAAWCWQRLSSFLKATGNASS